MSKINQSEPCFISLTSHNRDLFSANSTHLISNNLIVSSFFIGITGLGLNKAFVDSINYLVEKLPSSVTFCIIDKCESELELLSSKVLRISQDPMEQIPLGLTTENYQLSDLKLLFNEFHLSNCKYFVKLRKDTIIDVQTFISFIISIPCRLKDRMFLVSDLSSNALRKYCLSDLYFVAQKDSIPYGSELIFRTKSLKCQRFNFFFRQEFILFDNFQMEQWFWRQILSRLSPGILQSNLAEYYMWISSRIYFFQSDESGLKWSRSSSSHIKNWNRYTIEQFNLSKTTYPLTDYMPLNQSNINFFITNIDQILFIRLYIAIKQAIIIVLFKFPVKIVQFFF